MDELERTFIRNLGMMSYAVSDITKQLNEITDNSSKEEVNDNFKLLANKIEEIEKKIYNMKNAMEAVIKQNQKEINKLRLDFENDKRNRENALRRMH
ncbi:hypothetical protein [Methanosarcina barkeri]|uniref:Uncharacterized protein n=1 Tax=Methanosarcina barkeri 227 TaxID=1434106 RepID=A0A0E3R4V8_METBA|nr:hypothetical protein [Methanosarcina barkeri]AKB58485.1 hypothetical protein MSBR2_1969 [Methanosarcina barkeri 227]